MGYKDQFPAEYDRLVQKYGQRFADEVAYKCDELSSQGNDYQIELAKLLAEYGPDIEELISKHGPELGPSILAQRIGMELAQRSKVPIHVPNGPLSVFEATVLLWAARVRKDKSTENKAMNVLKKAIAKEVHENKSIRAADNALLTVFRILRIFG